MVDFKGKLENNRIFIGIIALFSILRMYLGMSMPIYIFPKAVHDDVLMFNYSHLVTHFTQWNIQSLSKDIAYPIFLFFVRMSHIPYRFWLSLLWIIAGILIIYAVYNYLTKDRTVILGLFLFILFIPVAFDNVCGQRVYRNAIIMPFTIIFLSMLYIFTNKLLDSEINIKNTLIWGILLGLTFTFTYYIKEDGILTLPILIVSIFAIVLFKLYEAKSSFSKQNLTKFAKITIIGIIPLLIFVGGTFAYQEVNEHYFGVSEINTRTSGEIGEFYANLLKIDDPNKNTRIWIPASTFEKAVNASPTLQSNPKFVNGWLDTKWGGGTLRNSTIPGDIVGWSLRLALENAGLYKNEKSASDFISNINDDLNSAFDSGELQKSNKIFITSSAAGKDMGEIMDLTPQLLYGISATFFYNGLEFNNVNRSDTSFSVYNDFTQKTSNDIHDNFISVSELNNLPVLGSIPIKLIGLDLGIYQVISYIVALLSFAGFIYIIINQVKNRFKNRSLNMLLLFCIMLIGTALVQIFSVTWFCSFLGTNHWVGSMDDITTHIKFYLVSAYGFYTMFAVLSIAGAYKIITGYKLDKNNFENTPTPQNSQIQEKNNLQPRQHTPKEQPQENYDIDINDIDPKIIEEIMKELEIERKK